MKGIHIESTKELEAARLIATTYTEETDMPRKIDRFDKDIQKYKSITMEKEPTKIKAVIARVVQPQIDPNTNEDTGSFTVVRDDKGNEYIFLHGESNCVEGRPGDDGYLIKGPSGLYFEPKD